MGTAREQYFRDLEDNYDASIATIKMKNEDYSPADDPFYNFREAALFAGVPVERAMLVRIGDKFGRYKNLLAKEEAAQAQDSAKLIDVAAVQDETVEDTLGDLLGYINILRVWRQWRSKHVPGYLYSGPPTEENYEVELVPEEPTVQDEQAYADMWIPEPLPEPAPETVPSEEATNAASRLRKLFGLK